MIFGNLILNLTFLSNVIIFCRNVINRSLWCISHLLVCACVFTYHETWCPVLRATFFWTSRCAVELTNTSVVRSSQELPRTDMQHSVTRCQRTCPRPAWLWVFIPAQGRWGCSGSPACSLGADPCSGPGLLGLWYSAAGQVPETAPHHLPPSWLWRAQILKLEAGINWHCSRLPERLPQGLGLAWKPRVSSSNQGRPVSEVATDDPELRWTVIPRKSTTCAIKKIDTPKFPGSLQQTDSLNNTWRY